MSDVLDVLEGRIREARGIDEALLRDAARDLRHVFPGTQADPDFTLDTTEAVLRLVDRCLPGWTIVLRGTAIEPDGHWHCALRESQAGDDDEAIGAGTGATVSLALLRALVAVARQRA